MDGGFCPSGRLGLKQSLKAPYENTHCYTFLIVYVEDVDCAVGSCSLLCDRTAENVLIVVIPPIAATQNFTASDLKTFQTWNPPLLSNPGSGRHFPAHFRQNAAARTTEEKRHHEESHFTTKSDV